MVFWAYWDNVFSHFITINIVRIVATHILKRRRNSFRPTNGMALQIYRIPSITSRMKTNIFKSKFFKHLEKKVMPIDITMNKNIL